MWFDSNVSISEWISRRQSPTAPQKPLNTVCESRIMRLNIIIHQNSVLVGAFHFFNVRVIMLRIKLIFLKHAKAFFARKS